MTIFGGRFPASTLWLTIPSSRLDVNVHPTKREVRFADDDGRDLPGRSGEEYHDQDRRKRDPCPFPVRGKRPGHAPNRLRHDRHGNDLEAVDKPRAHRSAKRPGTKGEQHQQGAADHARQCQGSAQAHRLSAG
mgnify:CR=1 FL=1